MKSNDSGLLTSHGEQYLNSNKGDKTMTKEEFIKFVNDQRKQNKSRWVVLQEDVDGTPIAIKFYNTWIQVFRTDTGINYAGPMDCSVKVFNEHLREVLG